MTHPAQRPLCWDRTEAPLMAEPEYDNGICSVQPKRAEAGLRGSLRNQAAKGESSDSDGGTFGRHIQ